MKRMLRAGAVWGCLICGPLAWGARGAEAVAAEALAAESLAAESLAASARAIDDFSLRDSRGTVHALSDHRQSKLVVVAFLGCECPVAKLFAPRLAALERQFGPRGVAFLGIDSNSQDSLSELAAFARAHELKFPLLKDPGSTVADRFRAQRTPEVFVLDAERRVRYHGRVDDQYLVGGQRPRPTRADLKLAIEELLDGKPVSVADTAVVGCHIGRTPKPQRSGNVTYSEHIAPLLQERCVACHRQGEVAPFPLTTYDEVVGWGETIREVVSQRRMPPWLANPQFGHFANNPTLSDDERQRIFDWLDGGAPEGDRQRLPAPRHFTAGWQIPQPDLVVPISDEPIDVPAEGTVSYRHYLVDPGFQEDRWIRAAECRPDNRAVVHHMVVNFIPPGARPRIGLNGAMVGYAPGIPPIRLPEGRGMLVPKGSRILFQMHYTPNGSPQRDRSTLGLVFVSADQVRQRVEGGGAANVAFELPAGADDVVVESRYRFNRATLLLSMMPHMHLRGKSFRYEARYPDDRTEVLLDVPRYDFNWQLRYELAEPKLLPAGTVLVCTAHFDNSDKNPVNPDPQVAVRWGEQTWDEMMIGYFGMMAADEHDRAGDEPADVVRDDEPAQRAARELIRAGLEALGGQQRLAEQPVVSFNTAGKVYFAQAPVDFRGAVTLDPSSNRMRMALNGQGFQFAIVLDRQRGWFKLNERVIELPREAIEEHSERLHAERVALLYPVLDEPGVELGLIEGALLAEQPVDGVRVRQADHRDVRLYFDPQSHLLLKVATEINETGKDILQETIYSDYARVDGVQRPRKVVLRWDGADRSIRDVSEYRSARQAAPDAFARPQ